jgi:ferredoxin
MPHDDPVTPVTNTYPVTVLRGTETITITAPAGANLRRTLLDAGFSPYGQLSRTLNCGGRGLCATCGVWLEDGAAPPRQWHDKIGASFGYPRLSCQITIDGPLTVRILVDKWMWGAPDAARRVR